MSNEPARTELMLPDDERLLAAITPVVQHALGAAASTESQEGLAAAAIEAARETFPLMEGQAAGEPKVRVVVSDFPDRVEVAIEHRGEALPTAGLDTFVKDAVAGSGAGLSMALQGDSGGPRAI